MPRILLLVDVVEHLESEWAAVPHSQDAADESCHVEGALTGELPVVEAPFAHVHVQPWCIRELYVEHLVAGYARHSVSVVAHGQHMEAVQTQPERRVVGSAHHSPGILERTQPSPGHGFVREADAALLGAAGQRVKLLRCQVIVVDPARGARRAAHQYARPQFGEHVELPLGVTQGRAEVIGRNRLDMEAADRPRSIVRGPSPRRPAGRVTRTT